MRNAYVKSPSLKKAKKSKFASSTTSNTSLMISNLVDNISINVNNSIFSSLNSSLMYNKYDINITNKNSTTYKVYNNLSKQDSFNRLLVTFDHCVSNFVY